MPLYSLLRPLVFALDAERAHRLTIAALKARQSCPEVHVFGARETTAPAGYGTASVVVDLVLGAYSGATSEAIDYPAWYDAMTE